ncbi:lantibiotic dehydratase [Algoriphagus alkaliphilus]
MSAVQNNWKSILTAIENASPHLFAEIKDHTYQDLPSSLKNKVYKYLVRGRYRSTPFGFFRELGSEKSMQSKSSSLTFSPDEL